MGNQYAVNKFSSIEKLVKNKMLLIKAEDYHVTMLSELWNLYNDEKKHHLCQNILFYCQVTNNFAGVPKKENPVLLISIKNGANDVTPFAYFKDAKIDLIENR